MNYKKINDFPLDHILLKSNCCSLNLGKKFLMVLGSYKTLYFMEITKQLKIVLKKFYSQKDKTDVNIISTSILSFQNNIFLFQLFDNVKEKTKFLNIINEKGSLINTICLPHLKLPIASKTINWQFKNKQVVVFTVVDGYNLLFFKIEVHENIWQCEQINKFSVDEEIIDFDMNVVHNQLHVICCCLDYKVRFLFLNYLDQQIKDSQIKEKTYMSFVNICKIKGENLLLGTADGQFKIITKYRQESSHQLLQKKTSTIITAITTLENIIAFCNFIGKIVIIQRCQELYDQAENLRSIISKKESMLLYKDVQMSFIRENSKRYTNDQQQLNYQVSESYIYKCDNTIKSSFYKEYKNESTTQICLGQPSYKIDLIGTKGKYLLVVVLLSKVQVYEIEIKNYQSPN